MRIGSFAAFLAMAALAAAAGTARAVGEVAVALDEGARAPVCGTGAVVCPATGPICDDPGIARIEEGRDGLEVVGVGPGTTLCSVMSATAVRQVFKVTVRAAPKKDAPR